MPTSAVSGWKQQLLDNPDLFLLHYFGDKINELKDFHLRLIDTATSHRRGLILYPASHGKTTLVSTLLPIWALCRDPEMRIALILKNDSDAKGVMRAIQFELLGNEQLIRDFGPFKADGDERKAWSLERMDVAGRTRMDKSSSIAAFGAGARTAIGYRTDWTICDDIITDKNSATPDQRQKVREWFNLGPETMSPHGRLTVIGTLFHPEDLYNDLIELRVPTGEHEGRRFYQVQREDAIVVVCRCGHVERDHHDNQASCTSCKCQGFVEDHEEALWPEERPILWLMERKASMGTLDFNKRYRNIAVDPSRMVFREEHVKGGYIGNEKYPGCLDENYRIGEYEPGWKIYCGFDPAVGVSRSTKFCAHLTLAVGSCQLHDRCYWVVDLKRDQMTLPQQVKLIIERHQDYDAVRSVIEANSAFAGLMQAVEQEMNDHGLALPITPHYTTRTNKPDPETGVERMAPWFEQGKVHIPWGDSVSRNRMKQFVEELIMYPGRYTDSVMAFWFAWREAQITAPKYKSFNRFTTRAGRTQKTMVPTGCRVVTNPYYDR